MNRKSVCAGLKKLNNTRNLKFELFNRKIVYLDKLAKSVTATSAIF